LSRCLPKELKSIIICGGLPLNKWLIITFIFVLYSCGKTTDEALTDVITSAENYLSKGQCQNAINLLELVGRRNENAKYLKALAFSYACRAGYSTVTLFATDLTKTASISPLGGLATYTTSTVSVQSPFENDPKFVDLMTALNILLYAGGIKSTTEPTTSERLKYFSASDSGDIDASILYLTLVSLGKYMHVYADTVNGVKGAGSGSNNCFTSYSNITSGTVLLALSNMAGACKVTNSSHVQLDFSTIAAPTRKRRLCQGVVILNTLIATLPSVLASASGGSLSSASAATAAITAAQAVLTLADPSIGMVASTMNQSICEDDSNVPVEKIEHYFALMFEGLIN